MNEWNRDLAKDKEIHSGFFVYETMSYWLVINKLKILYLCINLITIYEFE